MHRSLVSSNRPSLAHLKELEEGNRRLKKMYAEELLKTEIIAETIAKK